MTRGGVAKRYRYPHEDRRKDRRHATTGSRVAEVRALARELERRTRQRQRDTPGHFSDLDGWVRPEVYGRVRELLMAASVLMHDHNQPPRTPGTGHVSATSWIFQMTRKAV